MCGRYVSVKQRTDLVELLGGDPVGLQLRESFNVAPTNAIYGVLEHVDKISGQLDRQIFDLRWGLVAVRGAKDPKIGNDLINACVGPLAEKPSWRTAFRKRRAVVAAAGYYECTSREQDGKVRKQPYFIHPADGGVLSFPSLYEMWRDPTKVDDDPHRWLWTAVIVTTETTGSAGEFHDRSPLILPRDRVDAWLDPTRTEPELVYDALDGMVMAPLAVRPVSKKVNRVGNDGADLIDPLDLDHPEEPLQLTLTGRAA